MPLSMTSKSLHSLLLFGSRHKGRRSPINVQTEAFRVASPRHVPPYVQSTRMFQTEASVGTKCSQFFHAQGSVIHAQVVHRPPPELGGIETRSGTNTLGSGDPVHLAGAASAGFDAVYIQEPCVSVPHEGHLSPGAVRNGDIRNKR